VRRGLGVASHQRAEHRRRLRAAAPADAVTRDWFSLAMFAEDAGDLVDRREDAEAMLKVATPADALSVWRATRTAVRRDGA
jgi:hypothetical protein